jgi:hypothetical protein
LARAAFTAAIEEKPAGRFMIPEQAAQLNVNPEIKGGVCNAACEAFLFVVVA